MSSNPNRAIILLSEPSRTAPCIGDVVSFRDELLVWRKGWSNLEAVDEKIYALGLRGERQLVHLGSGSDQVWSKLSDEELAGLAGIEIWNGERISRLAVLDPDKTCISMHGDDSVRGAPDVVFQTTCLFVDGLEDSTLIGKFGRLKTLVLGDNSVSITDAILENVEQGALETLIVGDQPRARTLAKFKQLRVLRIEFGFDEPPLDLKFLGGLQNLQELDVGSLRVKNLEGLSCLTNMLRLDLGAIVGNQDLSALATLTNLVDLKLTGLASDLSPLATLKHLKSINADFTKITKLPMSAMASLEELSVMSTPLDDAQAAAFATLNPQCQVNHRYMDLLHRLDSATRVTVKATSRCGENRKAVPSLAGVAVQELLASIIVREPTEEMWIGCVGDFKLTFYKDDKKLGNVEYFSKDGAMNFLYWPATVEVTNASQKRINALLFGPQKIY